MENTAQPILIDGRIIAKTIKEEIRKEVSDLLDAGKRPPHLVAVIVGEDGASLSYVASKEKQSKEVGFTSSVYRFPETITEKELLETLDFLNNDPEVDGYIVQLPLPKHISERKVLESINPAKDVDGFHPTNEGRMMIGLPSYIPATPYGIKKLLDRSNIETEGKHCVVLGRSNIVGTPISILMSRNSSKANCTVTMCHSKTKNLKEICLQADIIIVAIGKPEFLTADMVKEGAVIVDVGIHRIPADNEKGYKIIGDVKYDEVAPKCKAITPVPGGVGPMTIVALLDNTLKAYKHEIYE
ncbi:MAG: bifunctional 5,10-methylene-tetrahydrofolate dehydrogenase/5,10-methylene-tetrahydrofolate cyclohydrolase [Bacteroidales bacterium]|jgi:methylenetetrahydrofolate dehydrogenase (NADP+)/methenyltetrahydrofolate cyclohydrolase|nr:bifunctional 5,10-methylene-tetrahydrofolate dehydrogenase/5,10-methylene-tetrahydrofolate cyclohydrolase [Bacteroidales bacterium]MBQ2397958.1 bifunctional 5,10-methylene-tetrahydrofolate dehydrogenase/5,10-methylene-tetrahydrofolate cyclohydrolase [Bacteroidales bacterium]MBQ5872890.1 bifunctional 5,10-methylene-tetrahydrofolate dehydrogenase/5,10-methylene-tetrahydrofolate cyclohydrolase [Bacteroidales bacterium]MBQ5891433.1 bifunctional 5,10-methylene-tetrahydrofolate dehydrogenase/5,10-m